MEIKNFADIEEKIFRKGLPKEMAGELQAAVDEGQTDILREHMTTVDKDQVGFRVHFRYDQESQMAYLNRIDTAIFQSPDFTGIREHTFHDYQLITAMEAYRLLKHGEDVAVNKNLRNKAGEEYNTWISLDLKGTKDENGNFPLKSFHQNYYGNEPYRVQDVLLQLKTPVKELEQPANVEKHGKLLAKAIMPAVTIMHNGQEQKGFLSVDPGNAGVKLFDASMNVVEAIARPRPEQKKTQKNAVKNIQQTENQGQNNVKKNSWNQSQGRNQGVNWTKQANKGQSM